MYVHTITMLYNIIYHILLHNISLFTEFFSISFTEIVLLLEIYETIIYLPYIIIEKLQSS